MTPCPTCNGAGKTIGYGCPGFRRIESDCVHCDGKGHVDDSVLERLNQAKAYRELRIAHDMSLRELARKAGIRPTALSAVERGMGDPPAALLAVYEELGA